MPEHDPIVLRYFSPDPRSLRERIEDDEPAASAAAERGGREGE